MTSSSDDITISVADLGGRPTSQTARKIEQLEARVAELEEAVKIIADRSPVGAWLAGWTTS